MDTTTDFEGWLDEVNLETHDEIYSLYRSVKDCDAMGFFTTELARNSTTRWIVKSDTCDRSLLLASELAKNTFLMHLERTHCGELDMEGWYGYHHAMEKND